MTMNRHEAFEELISASLHGDLSADERRRLDAHLDGCDRCRATLAAFAEQRRIVAGLRHLAPPRDLGARVRAGVDYDAVPWWRRPIAIFTGVGGGLAVVTGVLLALVMLNGTNEPPVGQSSPSPSASQVPATPTPVPTLPQPVELPGPTPTPPPGETPPPPIETPEATPLPASPEPDVYMAVADPDDDPAAITVHEGSTDDVVTEPETPPETTAGVPIAAELSSDGRWLAFVSEVGLSGMNELSATRVAEGLPSDDPEVTPPPDSPVAVGETVPLGQSVAGSPFLERLAWSRDGRYLAYTLADPAGGGTDVWIFEPTSGDVWQLTDVGDAYAGSWVTVDPGDADEFQALWVSTAEGEVTSYLVSLLNDTGGYLESIDPAGRPLATAEGVFQPLISPNGALAIYWDGRMIRTGDEWVFLEGGEPRLAEHKADDRPDFRYGFVFENDRALFSDVTVDRDAFSAAAISWGPDGDSYAVWDTAWTGLPQAPEGVYPDRSRVYFGHATDPRGLTRFHALDADDLPADGIVVDVKVSPTGAHLVITVRYPVAGDTETPRADLILVRRHTGDVDDEVETLRSGGWNGPAAFDADNEIEAP
jgi:putative zinc finger protein/WD40 repeat protein